jgi:N-acylneuraminate cytidylyltransferase
MDAVAFIPIKKTSRRVQSKNFRPFAGVPLYQWFLRKLEGTDMPFDAVYVDTDSEEVAEYAQQHGFRYLPREARLAEDTANGNDLLVHQAQRVEAQVYVQLFITAPLLRAETIRQSVLLLRDHPEHDSLFTAVKRFSWFWFEGQPVNYDPKVLPRSQDAKPIVQETTGLYAIRREALLRDRCRIGRTPYLLYVDDVEAVDIDTELEFKLAEFLYHQTKG